MVYQVGRPAMFEGNRFLPETGTPIWKMLRSKTVLADCDPEPLTVATWMVYQVGRPAMFEGNRFLPETGTPIWKMLRSKTVLADCDPEPLTVATWMLKSFTLRRPSRVCAACSRIPTSTVAMKYSLGAT